MINIDNRKMTIPYAEKNLGYEGDNAVAVRVFSVSDLSLSDYVFKLDIRKGNGAAGIVTLEKVVGNDAILLTWTLMETELDTPGTLTVQLRAYNESGTEVWHSGNGAFTVGTSINADSSFPTPLPSEFGEFERRVTEAVTLVQSVATRIGEIATGADGVSVTAAAVNGNGHLLLTLSNDTTIDCGYVVGPTGAPGQDGLPSADGSPGRDGIDGSPGQDGADAVVDYAAINATLSSLLAAKLQSVDALPAEPVADVVYFIRE